MTARDLCGVLIALVVYFTVLALVDPQAPNHHQGEPHHANRH